MYMYLDSIKALYTISVNKLLLIQTGFGVEAALLDSNPLSSMT